jgi:hypothetical protein
MKVRMVGGRIVESCSRFTRGYYQDYDADPMVMQCCCPYVLLLGFLSD